MGEYDISMKYRILMKGIKRLDGLSVKHASNHDTVTHLASGRKTTVPRHTELNKITVGTILDFLISTGYSRETIRKTFKIRK